jgi:hypothetical protein
MRRNRFSWGDLTYVEVDPPRRIVAAGRGGKGNDVRMRSVFVVDSGSAGTTRLTWAIETRPTTLGGRIAEGFLGQRRFYKRRLTRALKRLRRILEEGRDRGARATIAASGR